MNCLLKSLSLTMTGACMAAHAVLPADTEVHEFHIPQEDAARGVRDLARQAGAHLSLEGKTLLGLATHPVDGRFAVTSALQTLTAGTGITLVYLPERRELRLTSVAEPVSDGGAVVDPREEPPGMLPPVELPDVTVTAQRRPQDLQTVPLSARSIAAPALAEQRLDSLYALSEVNPDIHVGENSRSANLYIRGTGSGESQVFDQSVGVFVDDVFHGRARTSEAAFLDLDHIEVLKGPQTTFFGNNAIAGALNIVSRAPTANPEGFVRLLYGEHGDYAAEAAQGGTLFDPLAIRVAVLADGSRGWLHNQTIDRDVPGSNNLAGRVSLRFEPGTGLEAVLKIEGSKSRNVGALAFQDTACPPPAPFSASGFCQSALNAGAPFGLDNNRIAQNAGQEIVLTTGEYVLTVKYPLGGATLTSVTAFYHYHFNELEDTDGTPLQLFNVTEPEKYSQLSQELRVASPSGQRFEYLAGLYYQADQLDYSHDNSYFFLTPAISASAAQSAALAPLVPYLPLGQVMVYSQPETTYSAFASGTYQLTDSWSLSAGLRGTSVRNSYALGLSYGTAAAPYGDIQGLPADADAVARMFASQSGLGVAGQLSGARRDRALMPSAGLQHHSAQGSVRMLEYVSFTRGFKAGGFNGNDTTGIASNVPFAPEFVNAYEAGLKSEWLERRLRINAAAFRSDYTGLQVATNVAGMGGAIQSLVRNAAASRSQGAELELSFLPSAAWSFEANASYDESRYQSYPGVAPTQLQQLAGYSSQDLSGRPTEFAPKWSGMLRVTRLMNLPAGLVFTSSVAGIASSRFYLTGNDDPAIQQGGYVRLDARLTLESPMQGWAVDLIAKNITDRDIATFGINWPNSPGSVWLAKEEPRNVAAQLRLSW